MMQEEEKGQEEAYSKRKRKRKLIVECICRMYLLNLKKEEMDDNYINMYVEICFRHFDIEFLIP